MYVPNSIYETRDIGIWNGLVQIRHQTITFLYDAQVLAHHLTAMSYMAWKDSH